VVGAPDYAAAFVGWRSWLVVLVEGEFRLCSPVYPMIWPPRAEARAFCRGKEKLAARSRPADHRAPGERCRCGIYASASPGPAAQLLAHVIIPDLAYPVEQPVLGRVSLWGQVVECEHGWRGACAYPAALYVPALGGQTPSAPGRRRLTRLIGFSDACTETPHPERVARALERYGVPVELIACRTLRHAAEQLAQP
jgi:hypothetical protein